MQKTNAKYEKPELRKVKLVASEAMLTACKTTSGLVIDCFCGDSCKKWFGGWVTTLCHEAGS